MRTSTLILSTALALIPSVGFSQEAGSSFTPAAAEGMFDVGVRGTSLNGDPARYERYRDLGDGMFLETIRFDRNKNGWFFDAIGEHVGRRDQRFIGNIVQPGKWKIRGMWDQIPMLMSVTTQTLFSGLETDELRIDNAIQALVQANVNTLPPLFDANAVTFDTKSRRYTGEGNVEYLASNELTFRSNIRIMDKSGIIPYGGSFGHSSLVETLAPVEHRTTDFDGNAEYVRGRLLLRGGYTGSWFSNDSQTLTFDNPFRATDVSATPSAGRSSLPPGNSFVGVNGLAAVGLPGKSRVTAYLSAGSLKDAGDPIMPQTINTANTALITPLARASVDGEAKTMGANLTFTSRPNRHVDFNARYRYYDYDNKTPDFIATQRVSYDNAPSAAVFETEPFSIQRSTFDADFRLTPGSTGAAGTAGIGYSYLGEDRTHRIFESASENVFRLTYDAVGTNLFSVRTKYEHGQKRGDGDEAEIAAELLAIGEQPGMRHFDVASRDRNRVTVLGSLSPFANASFSGSVAVGKDDYIESEFGLRDNTHHIYTVGFDAIPTGAVNVGFSYSYEHYNAFSRSRQANPATPTGCVSQYPPPAGRVTCQFDDPTRNWASDGNDRAHSVIWNAFIPQIGDKVDLTLGFDYNRSRSTYDYVLGPVPDRTLPEEVEVPTTLPPPTELPPVFSSLTRGNVDLVYSFNSHVGIGVTYWYEAYRVEDFTLDADANVDLVRGQVVLIGYLYRPYTANTYWGRLIYRW
jgi:MtrB/PioB family decaheme-associated outer membrane protein